MTDFAIDVRDKTAIVTGGAKGIGWAIAEAFASCGAKVMIADLESSGEADLRVKASGGRMALKLTDITNLVSVREMVDETQRLFGGVHILVNNAGVMYKSLIEDLDIEQWQRLLDVNLTGAAICTKVVAPIFKKQNWGRIINISSMQAMLGSPTYTAYTASKAGLSGLTRVWAAELAPCQITVNALCPSFAETPMLKAALQKFALENNISVQEAADRFLEPVPLKRFLKPEEIAFCALFLASPLAQSITGHDLLVAAGRVMS
jgi:NAD(P)-dependent dehydrogenase (short-subunit alcohol dehydrogenase family)